MGTVYTGTTNKTYTYTRVRVDYDYNTLKATATLLHSRTNTWSGEEYTKGRDKFTFANVTSDYLWYTAPRGQHWDDPVISVQFSFSPAGGTYYGSCTGSVCGFSGEATIPAATYTNSIAHWTFGYKNQEGNNGNKTAYKIGDTSFTATYNNSIKFDSSRAITVPNGFALSTTIGSNSFSSDGSWTSYSMPATFNQPAKNTSVQYDYRPVDYTITYTLNGGTNSSSNPSTYNVLYGVTFANPSRTGYTFKNWTIGGSAVTGINPGANATWSSIDDLYNKCSGRTTGNKTVVANWTANTYTVNFNANGGSTPTASKTVTYDSTYGTLPTPTRDGYTFDGWYTAASGGTKITSSTKVSITAAQTLYAHWTLKTYTITYNANGGTGAPGNQTKNHGTNITLSTTKPTKASVEQNSYIVSFDDADHYIQLNSITSKRSLRYAFTTWNTNANGSGTSYASGATYSGNANLTLYAQWNETKVQYDITLPTAEECVRPNYILQGFATTADGPVEYEPGVMYVPSSNITLYAIWSVDQVQVKIKTNKGWVKGKLFIKVNGHWVKGKKIFKKENNTWVPGINS